ncbi:MAG: GTP pyrophosphokinase family protein [Eubacterium sp.]|nr:GTP pyrophosphokinase family protein [Eubacterium sp.]
MESIYGRYESALYIVQDKMEKALNEYQQQIYEKTQDKGYEHILVRIKSDESMREKCRRKGIEENEYSALFINKDAIGIRIVCSFIEDIFSVIKYIRTIPDVEVIEEKDYIQHAKPNGYRSYHMILGVKVPYPDVTGADPGTFYVEMQIRTIAMDTWAALEHKMKYKKDIPNQALLVSELKRVADELASCDLSMQTIRDLIDSSGE